MQLIIPARAITRIAQSPRARRAQNFNRMLQRERIRAEYRRLFFLCALLVALVLCIASFAL